MICLVVVGLGAPTRAKSHTDGAHVGTVAQKVPGDGTIYFTDWRRRTIWRMRPDGTQRRRVTRYPFRGGSGDFAVSVARKRNRLVFVRTLGNDMHAEVFRARRDGSRVQRLTRAGRLAIGADAAISPDGSRVAFIKREALWVMRSDGRRARRLVDYAGHDYVEMPSFSPDGTKVLFNHTMLSPTGPADNEELVVVNVDGSGRRVIGPRFDEVTAPRLSPDGTRIIYGCGNDDTHALCLIDLDGQRHSVLRERTGWAIGGLNGRSGTTAAWSPSGDEIVFDCRKNRLCVVRSDGTGLRLIGRGGAPDWG